MRIEQDHDQCMRIWNIPFFFRIIHSMSACTKLSIVAYHNIRVYISNIIL